MEQWGRLEMQTWRPHEQKDAITRGFCGYAARVHKQEYILDRDTEEIQDRAAHGDPCGGKKSWGKKAINGPLQPHPGDHIPYFLSMGGAHDLLLTSKIWQKLDANSVTMLP
jgi:hypothetical protein